MTHHFEVDAISPNGGARQMRNGLSVEDRDRLFELWFGQQAGPDVEHTTVGQEEEAIAA